MIVKLDCEQLFCITDFQDHFIIKHRDDGRDDSISRASLHHEDVFDKKVLFNVAVTKHLNCSISTFVTILSCKNS